MQRDRTLEVSLLLIRLSVAAFLFVWVIDKISHPDHAQSVFLKFYHSTATPDILKVIGFIQGIVVFAFAIGAFRFWSYGLAALMHLVSTLSSWERLLAPWAPGGSLLFWAGVPVLAAMIALFALRDRDRLFSLSGHSLVAQRMSA